ncbi:MAG TPA: hypothetical protein VN803_14635 [Gemmatimonadales bacterium]|nr:hypothetical protein [Gemmatimonadales bacterium]
MTAPIAPEYPWSQSAKQLRQWFIGYLLTFSAGIFLLSIARASAGVTVGVIVIVAALIPYLASIAFAYRVQRALNQARLYKPGAWQIIAGALLLNPFLLGFLIPVSVLWVTKRIEKKIGDGRIDYHPAGVVS